MTEFPTHGIAKNPGRWKNACGVLALLFLVAVSVHQLSADDSSPADSADALLRIGLSTSTLTDVNENDVKAAMKVWSQVLLKERGLPVDPQISLLKSIDEISGALRSKRIDAISLTTDEYWALEREMKSSHVVVGLFDGGITEEYVLLVHRESGIERIGDLRGRGITFFMNPRMSLASVWLDTLLVKEGLGPTSKFCGRVTRLNKLPLVVLPVFFRQSDACLVTRRGFQTMSELNPQVGRQLKVIASSPALVTGGFFFRGDCSQHIRDRAFAEFDRIHTTAAGQQALTVFQSGTLEVRPISVLNSAFELLADHGRLCAPSKETKTGLSRPVRNPEGGAS